MTEERAMKLVEQFEKYYSTGENHRYPPIVKQAVAGFAINRIPDKMFGMVLSQVIQDNERKYGYFPDVAAMKRAVKELYNPFPEWKALPAPELSEEETEEMLEMFEQIKNLTREKGLDNAR